MTIKEVKSLFSEKQKRKYEEHAKKNNGLSFHEFCKKIKKESEDKSEPLLFATETVEAWFYTPNYEF